ncbi:MAG: sulfotransferase family protein [Polyangiaceae bacterium]
MQTRPFDLCFVHVPKAAGVSVIEAFGAALGERELVERGPNHALFGVTSRPGFRFVRIGHETRVQGCLTLAEYRQRRAQCFVFAFVRNPFDRLVSAFHFLSRTDLPPLDLVDRARFILPYAGDFGGFVRNELRTDEPAVFQQIHLRPAYTWLCDDDGHLLADFVGKVETLDADVAEIARRFALAGPVLPKLNATPHRPFAEHYDAETRALVARAYQRDFELFGYDPSRPG